MLVHQAEFTVDLERADTSSASPSTTTTRTRCPTAGAAAPPALPASWSCPPPTPGPCSSPSRSTIASPSRNRAASGSPRKRSACWPRPTASTSPPSTPARSATPGRRTTPPLPLQSLLGQDRSVRMRLYCHADDPEPGIGDHGERHLIQLWPAPATAPVHPRRERRGPPGTRRIRREHLRPRGGLHQRVPAATLTAPFRRRCRCRTRGSPRYRPKVLTRPAPTGAPHRAHERGCSGGG